MQQRRALRRSRQAGRRRSRREPCRRSISPGRPRDTPTERPPQRSPATRDYESPNYSTCLRRGWTCAAREVSCAGEVTMKLLCGTLALAGVSVMAAAPAPKPAAAKPAASKPTPKPAGTLAQVMRGIYFPNANLIFDVQQNDPGAPKAKGGAGTGSGAGPDPNAYAGWETAEDRAIAR